MTIWGSRRFAFVLCVFQTNGTHTWAAQMCVQIQTFGFSWVHQSTLSNLFRIVFCHITSCDCRGIKQKKHPVLTKLRDPKKNTLKITKFTFTAEQSARKNENTSPMPQPSEFDLQFFGWPWSPYAWPEGVRFCSG